MTNYQPLVDLIGYGKPLPEPRTPVEPPAQETEIAFLQLLGYSVVAGVRDGRPFVAHPSSTKDEALAALQAVVDALEADDQ